MVVGDEEDYVGGGSACVLIVFFLVLALAFLALASNILRWKNVRFLRRFHVNNSLWEEI